MKTMVGKGAVIVLLPLFIFSLTRYKLITEPDEELLRLTIQAVKKKHSVNKYNAVDLYILKKMEPNPIIPDASGRTALEYAVYSNDVYLVKSVATLVRKIEYDKCMRVLYKLQQNKGYFDESYLQKVASIFSLHCQDAKRKVLD